MVPRGGYRRWEGTLEVSGNPRHVWTANKWKLFLSDVLNPTAWQILFGRDIEVLKSRPISEVSRPEWIEAPVKGICPISSGGVVAPVGPFHARRSIGRQNEEEILRTT